MKQRYLYTADGKRFDLDTLGISIKAGSQQESEFRKLYGENVIIPQFNFISLAELLNKNVYHSVCVSTFAKDVVGMGWNVWNVNKEEDDKTKLIAEAIKRWNISENFKRFLMDKATIGQGYLEVVRNDSGSIDTLKHMPGVHVLLTGDDDLFCQQILGSRRYFKRFGSDINVNYLTGKSMNEVNSEEAANEVFMGIYYDPANRLYGKAPIIPALQDIVASIKLSEFNTNFFGNNAVPAWAVTVTGRFDDPEMINDMIVEQLREIQNNNAPGQAVVLAFPSFDKEGEVHVEFQSLSADTKDMHFEKLQQTSRDNVLSCHQVPTYRLGLAEMGSLGGNVAKETTEIYKATKIRPEQTELEDFVNTLILQEFGVGYRFEFNEIDTEDEMADLDKIAKERDTWMKEYSAGLITKNEYRKLTGREPLNEFGADFTRDEQANALAEAEEQMQQMEALFNKGAVV